MKLFAVLIAFASFVALARSALAPEMKKHFTSIVNGCLEKAISSDEAPSDLFRNIRYRIRENQCALSCVMRGVNFLNSSGKLDKGAAMFIMMGVTDNDPEQMKIAEGIIKSCVGLRVSDDS